MSKTSNQLTQDSTLNLQRGITVWDWFTGKMFKIKLDDLKTLLGLAAGTAYLGAAVPTTNPGTPTSPVFYTVAAVGTYTNFLDASSNPIVINSNDGLVILSYNGTSWSKQAALLDLSNYYSKTDADSKFVAPDGVGNIIAAKISETQWQHTRGDAELIGNVNFQNAYTGIWEQITNRCIVNSISIPYYGGLDTSVLVRVYKSAAFNANPASLTLLEEVSIPAGSFNINPAVPYELSLANDYFINANEYLYVFVVLLSGFNVFLQYFDTVSSSPARHRFLLGSAINTWTSAWTLSSGTFYQATFKVKYLTPARKEADLLINKGVFPDSNGNFYGGVPATMQWQHSRGNSENTGDSTYVSGAGTSIGFYDKLTNRVVFNTIELPIWAGPTSAVTVRVYKVANRTVNAINNLILVEEKLYAAGTFNTSSGTLMTVTLANKYVIEANTTIVVMFWVTAGTALSMKYFSSLFGSAPERHTFMTTTNSTPFAAGVSWGFSSTGFYQPAFNIKYVDSDIKDLKDRTKNLETNAVVADSNHNIQGVNLPEVQWQHARGDTEIMGNLNFDLTNVYGIGYYEQVTAKALFNHIQIAYYASANSIIRVRIYKSSSFNNNVNSLTLLDEIVFAQGAFNTDSSKMADIYTSVANISINANEYVYVLATADSGGLIKSREWTVDTTSPARHRFIYYQTNPVSWTAAWQVSSGAHYQATFKLLLTNTNNRDAINALAALAIPNPRIVLPSNIYAIAGFQLNIYYDAIMLAAERGSSQFAGYTVTVDCSVGYGYQKYYSLNATAGQAGTYPFTVKVWDYAKNLIASKKCNLVVIAPVAFGTQKRILRIGDSLTNPQETTKAIRDNLLTIGGTTPLFFGTIGSDPYKREGRSGWKFSDFIGAGPTYFRFDVSGVTTNPSIGANYTNNGSTFSVQEVNITAGTGYINCTRTSGSNNPLASGTLTRSSGSGDSTITYSSTSTSAGNPLWNSGTNALDIANYRTVVLGMAAGAYFDLVDIQLGINDVGQTPTSVLADSSITAIINNAKTLCDAFLADNPSCKIIIQLTPTCNSTGGGFTASNMRAYYMLNHWKLREAIIAAFDNSAYNANIIVGYNGAFMHRFYGYPQEQRTISARYTGVTEENNTNNVHPQSAGYYEIGDGNTHQVYAMLQ